MRKSKSCKKRKRPLKREAKKSRGTISDSKCKSSNKCRQSGPDRRKVNIHLSKKKIGQRRKIELELALKKSRTEHNLKKILKRFADTRLLTLLRSNGLERRAVYPDGNCFFNAILAQINLSISATELRQELCNHLLEHEDHYKGYTTGSTSLDEVELSHQYVESVNNLKKDGVWNVALSDILPLATANYLKRRITIYTSKLNNPVIQIVPDLHTCDPSPMIYLCYLAMPGLEHYDACFKETASSEVSKKQDTTTQISIPEPTTSGEFYKSDMLTKTPTKSSLSKTAVVTPIKDADYLSPIKKKINKKTQV